LPDFCLANHWNEAGCRVCAGSNCGGVIVDLWHASRSIVLFHQWGDEESAMCSQEFVRVFVWSVVLTATHNSICQLLIVAGHAYIGTIVSILIGLTNVSVSGLLVNTRESKLTEVGLT
jgi:Na+-driven multidrug efflux pump